MNRHERRTLMALVRRDMATTQQLQLAARLGERAFPWLMWRGAVDALKGMPRSFQRSR